mmetsp:Transcript_97585/g.232287  ORF Transcript_97585/g.232287 Transcript_97585/m.232287 type:complete len:242 (+) Transcript_97585:157-882(+)
MPPALRVELPLLLIQAPDKVPLLRQYLPAVNDLNGAAAQDHGRPVTALLTREGVPAEMYAPQPVSCDESPQLTNLADLVLGQVQSSQRLEGRQLLHVLQAVAGSVEQYQAGCDDVHGGRAELQRGFYLLMGHQQFLQLSATLQAFHSGQPVVTQMQLLQHAQALQARHAGDPIVLQVQLLQPPQVMEAGEAGDQIVVRVQDVDAGHQLQALQVTDALVLNLQMGELLIEGLQALIASIHIR